ncbi:MAG: DNA translocase FtsK [Ruminococcaceae bacterium]|nr:DNA translocase FtsK [Oscillospiraceae bacterium]
MRRTRERIEKTKKTEDITEQEHAAAVGSFADSVRGDEIVAGEVLDAVEIAAIGMRSRHKNGVEIISDFDEADENDIAETSDAESDFEAPFDLDEESISGETDTLKLISQMNKSSSGVKKTEKNSEEEFDVSKIFVNPEDAQLLDKLSEAYRKDSLDVKRETVSAPKTEELKKTKAPMPEYKFPPIDILAEDNNKVGENIKDELQDNAVKLVETLKSFNVKTKIENISRGPTITRYELLPEPGTRVRSIVNLVDDIALNLATTGVRIEAPIPGKSAVGIEVPNKKQATVHLRTLIEDERFDSAKSKLTVCLGEDVAGEAVYFDIGKMPHLLIAGCTGSGKSVCINSIITSLLYKASPDDVKMILIDPKKVELNIYNGIPHLLVPVVSEPKKAAGSLSWAVSEMERRFGLIESVGVRDIKAYNEVTKNDPDYEYMPRIVIIIDELADLMMTAPDDVEDSICRIAQKARAAGMHLVIGTQRPSVDVITGLIKANVPSRIAFRTSSQIDSRTIIDVGSAANLIGMGDMLFNPVGALKPRRVQGAYVSESDVEEVVAYIKNMNSSYDNSGSEKIVNEIEREAQRCGVSGKKGASAAADDGGEDEDPMLKAAIELAVDSGKISTSLIQRRLSLGYGRAAKLIDRMEQLGYVSAPDGQKPREVLLSRQDFMEMRLKDEAPFDL